MIEGEAVLFTLDIITGVEFIVTTQAFYCKLCKEFAGDASCAEHHLQSEQHYKKYIVSVVNIVTVQPMVILMLSSYMWYKNGC